MPLERIEAALEHAGADIGDQLGLAFRSAVEFRRPFAEGAVAVSDRSEPQGRDVTLHPHRRFEDRVGAEHVVVGEPEQTFADAVAVAQPEIANATDPVGRLTILDPALGDRRMPVRQAVEVADARPDFGRGRRQHARCVDPRHVSVSDPSAGRVAATRRRLTAGRRRRFAAPAFAAGLLGDALHVGRFAHQAAEPRQAAALDADLFQHLVDHRRLHAVAQRRLDHLVGRIARGRAAATGQPVDMQNADALDLLDRLDAFAHDAFHAIEQTAPEQSVARLIGEHVLGLVEQLLRLGLDRGAHLFGLRGDLFFLCLLLGEHDLDRLAALGHFAFTDGVDTLGRFRRLRARFFRLHLRRRFLERLLVEVDGLVHHRGFDRKLALDLEPAQIALAVDARFVEPAFRRDACPLHLLTGGDFRLLQGLRTRNFELLKRAPPLDARGLDRLFARDLGDLDALARGDVGLPHLAVGVRALDAPRGDLDHAALFGDLDRLLVPDIEHFAGLDRLDAIVLERKLHCDARALDLVAFADFRCLDRLLARDVARTRLLLGSDPVGRELALLRDLRGLRRFGAGDLDLLGFAFVFDSLGGELLALPDAGDLDRLAGLDVGLVHRPVALDFQPAHALFLRDARGFRLLARSNARLVDMLRALDFQRLGCFLSRDAVGGQRLLARDAGGFRRLLCGDLGLLDRAGARDFEAADPLLGRNAVDVDRGLLRDAQFLGRLACRDIGLLDRLCPLDLAPLVFLILGDAGLGNRLLLRDARFLGLLAGGDLGLLDRARALDFTALRLLILGDTRFGHRALLQEPRLLDFFPRQDFRLLHRLGALDFTLSHLAFRGDARFRDRLLIGDARLLDLFAGGDLRLLGLGFPQRALARRFRALGGAAHFDVALLFEARGLALAFDFERLPLRFEVARADADHRVLLDVVAQLPSLLDLLDQLGQAFGIETIRRIKILQIGLVEIGDRDRFENEAVLRERFGSGGLDALDIFAALLVHLMHAHLGRDRAQRRHEFAGKQRMQALLLHGTAAERGGGGGDRFARRRDPHIELRLDIDAHAVPRDQRVLILAHDLHLQHVHVNRCDVVDDRQHECAAVDHHLFAEQTGADKRHFLRGPAIEPVHEVHGDRDDNDRDDQPEYQVTDQLAGHGCPPLGKTSLLRGTDGLAAAADPLEFPRLFGQRDFHGQSLHRGCAIEAVAIPCVLQDEFGVLGLRDRAAMNKNDDVGTHFQRGLRPSIDQRRAIGQLERALGADGSAGRQPEVTDDDIGTGSCHVARVVFTEDIGSGQHVLAVCFGDHIDLEAEAHAGFFEVGADGAVEQPDRREVLHAGKAHRLELIEKHVHQPERIGAADAGKHRRVLHEG